MVGLIEQGRARAVAVQADVSKVADVKPLFDAYFEKYGRLDILVNNAGVMFTKPVVEVGEEPSLIYTEYVRVSARITAVP